MAIYNVFASEYSLNEWTLEGGTLAELAAKTTAQPTQPSTTVKIKTATSAKKFQLKLNTTEGGGLELKELLEAGGKCTALTVWANCKAASSTPAKRLKLSTSLSGITSASPESLGTSQEWLKDVLSTPEAEELTVAKLTAFLITGEHLTTIGMSVYEVYVEAVAEAAAKKSSETFIAKLEPTAGKAVLLGSEVTTINHEEPLVEKKMGFWEFEATSTGYVDTLEFFTGAGASTCTSVVLGIMNAANTEVLGEGTFTGIPGTSSWFKATLATRVKVVSGTKYFLMAMPLGGTLKIEFSKASGGTPVYESEKAVAGSVLVANEKRTGPFAIGPSGFQGQFHFTPQRNIFRSVAAKLTPTVTAFTKAISLGKTLTGKLEPSASLVATKLGAIVKIFAATLTPAVTSFTKALSLAKKLTGKLEPKGSLVATKLGAIVKILAATLSFAGATPKSLSVAKTFAAALTSTAALVTHKTSAAIVKILTATLLASGPTVSDSLKREPEENPFNNGWEKLVIFETDKSGAANSEGWYPVESGGGSHDCGAYWTASELSEPTVTIEFHRLNAPTWDSALWACVAHPSSSEEKTGYQLLLGCETTGVYFFNTQRTKGLGGEANSTETKGVAVAIGDKVRLTVERGKVQAWHKSGEAAWTLVHEKADSTYNKGFVGFWAETGTVLPSVVLRNFEAVQGSLGVLVKQALLSRIFAAKLTPAVTSFTKAISLGKTLTASLTSTGAVTKAFSVARTFAGKLTFSGSQSRSTFRSLTAKVEFKGTITKAFKLSHTLAAELTFAGTARKGFAFARKLAAKLEFSGAVSATTGIITKALEASLSFAGRQSRNTFRALAAKVQFAGSSSRNIVSNLVAKLSLFPSTRQELLVGASAVEATNKTVLKEGARYIRFTAAETGMVSSLFLYCQEAVISELELGIYSDSGEAPAILLGHAKATLTEAVREAWVEVSGLSVLVQKGTVYWLGLVDEKGQIILKQTTGTVANLRRSTTGTEKVLKSTPPVLALETPESVSFYAFGTTGGLQRTISHSFAATQSFIGGLTKNIARKMLASVGFVGIASRNVSRAFKAQVGLVGFLPKSISLVKTFGGTLQLHTSSPEEQAAFHKYAVYAVAAFEALQANFYAGSGLYFEFIGEAGKAFAYQFGRAVAGTIDLNAVNPVYTGHDYGSEVQDRFVGAAKYLLPVGSNVLTNPSFEEGAGTWAINNHGETELEVSEAQSYLGKRSLKVKINGGTAAGINSAVGVSVTPGAFYSASAYFYSEQSHGAMAGIDIRFLTSAGATIETAEGTRVAATANQWGRCMNIKRKAPANAAKAIVIMRYAEVITNVYTDGVTLAEGVDDVVYPDGATAGYTVAPVSEATGASTRFGDDNAWLGLAFAQDNEVALAQSVFNYVWPHLSAGGHSAFNITDAFQTGGIVWQDPAISPPSTNQRTTTTQAGVAELAAWLISLDPRNGVLYKEAFEATFNWAKEYLYNVPASPNYDATKPALMFDHINHPANTVAKGLATYNQGQMIAAAVRMYGVTKELGLLEFAETLAEASLAHFTESEYISSDEAAFNAIYFRGLFLLYRVTPNGSLKTSILAAAQTYANDCWENHRSSENLFTFPTSKSKVRVIDQASMVQLFALLSETPYAYSELQRNIFRSLAGKLQFKGGLTKGLEMGRLFEASLSFTARQSRNVFRTLGSRISFGGKFFAGAPPIKRIGRAGVAMWGVAGRIVRTGSIRRTD